ncbi:MULTISPECIES: DMT family transporter [Acidiphilium]|uniref:EamA-like transporter family protein n=1 Tax=Acidiphilium rubrum TaxID=526 RepID=A0A8G2FCX9_ACIRU|nr:MULTISPECIES: DMT family transporter [Acidiphilium]SIQ57222.1 EamA-like transporter family protein [Acidiphilium rubrum]
MSLIPAWIPVTIAAALFQVWRTALQARLRGTLSPGGAGFVRYLYALPVDYALLAATLAALGAGLPSFGWGFTALCLVGGIAQIFGTNLLIMAFAHRNFVVGTAYAKTEAAQLVIVSVLLFGAHIPAIAIIGIMLAVAGVLALSLAGQSMAPRALLRASVQPAALCGLGSGFAFAITAIVLRNATLVLPPTTPILLKAMLVLALANTLQTLAQGSFMAIRSPAELRKTLLIWRRAAPIGVLSALGSGCWFIGFALTNVALVRGFGQIEILFTLAVGHFYLKERTKPGEITGLVMVGLGVIMIAAAGIG